jgi:cytochrome c oxidase cbb3-type subunit 2
VEGESAAQLRIDLARMAKFGLKGTDMPGHEYLPDEQVLAIADYIIREREAGYR